MKATEIVRIENQFQTTDHKLCEGHARMWIDGSVDIKSVGKVDDGSECVSCADRLPVVETTQELAAKLDALKAIVEEYVAATEIGDDTGRSSALYEQAKRAIAEVSR